MSNSASRTDSFPDEKERQQTQNLFEYDEKTGEYRHEKSKIEKSRVGVEILLHVQGLNVYYGKIHALHDIGFDVYRGEIVSLIGANGAGKTTTLQAVSRLLKIRSGEVSFKGELIDHIEPHLVVRRGMAHVPEGRRMFTHLTVEDNLLMGAFTVSDKEMIRQRMTRAYDLFPRLAERRKQLAGTLSGGEQQMLAISRALMSNPELLLLDEPSMGLSPLIVQDIFRIIREINQEGTTILLVEQNAQMALYLSHRAMVLANGRIILEGSARELLENDAVQKAYLGG